MYVYDTCVYIYVYQVEETRIYDNFTYNQSISIGETTEAFESLTDKRLQRFVCFNCLIDKADLAKF